MEKKAFFREKLLQWFARNHRPLPWKGEKDPYKIWLSEVILQQTRVEQGMPYFQRFVEKYPEVRALAAAPEDEVLKLWQGLGYYSRARNLHTTARHVAESLGGQFPGNFEGLRALRGVGDYTAAAIASFAFDLPHAVVDGNVYRVLARFFGIETPVDLPAAKKEFSKLADELLDPARPGDFNQAIMDFGATHCTPAGPKCGACPLAAQCVGFQENRVADLPRKSKSLKKRERHFCYFVFDVGGETFIRKRAGRDIWQGLYEFPMVELEKPPESRPEIEQLALDFLLEKDATGIEISGISKTFRQVLTHQIVSAVFIEISIKNADFSILKIENTSGEYIRTNRIRLKKMFAVPRIIDSYLRENSLLLNLF